MTQVSTYITCDMLFKDVSTEFPHFRNMISKLSCSDAIFWCARINLALSATGNELAQRPLFDMLATQKEKYWLNKVIRRQRGNSNNTIFFRGQMLELIRWIVLFCHDHPDDGSTFNDNENRTLFLKCALLASDIWSKQTYGDKIFGIEKDPTRVIKYASASFRKGIEATRSAPDLFVSCGRAWIFYQQYFRKYHSSFNEDFLSVTGLTFEEYIVCFSAIATHFIDPLNKPCVINKQAIGDTTLIPEKIKAYVQLESQTLEELCSNLWGNRGVHEISEINTEPLNTISLREKPIYSAPDGRSVVMDPIYFHERVLTSPLFHMIPLNREKANEIFVAFGYAFEDYCCDILERMYLTTTATTNHTLLRQKEYRYNGQHIQIDAIIKQNHTAVLFEIKASFIKESQVNLDGASYVEELRKKYSNIVEHGQVKVKGVGQLSRIIKNILQEKFEKMNSDLVDINEIFPVLLVHDNLLDAPLTIEFLREEFQKLFENDLGYPVEKCPINIHILTVMTINDLEHLENSVQHFNIISLLRDFVRQKSESLHDFIANSKKYGYYRNVHLLDTSIEILGKTRTLLFNSPET